MKAYEAFEKLQKAKIRIRKEQEEELRSIYIKIEKEIENGKDYIDLRTLSKEHEAILKEMGYEVKIVNTGYNEQAYRVSVPDFEQPKKEESLPKQ